MRKQKAECSPSFDSPPVIGRMKTIPGFQKQEEVQGLKIIQRLQVSGFRIQTQEFFSLSLLDSHF
jgi:hypothetical protein